MPAGDNNGYSYEDPKNPYPGPPINSPFSADGSNYAPVTQQYRPPVPLSEAPAHNPNYELDGEHRS